MSGSSRRSFSTSSKRTRKNRGSKISYESLVSRVNDLEQQVSKLTNEMLEITREMYENGPTSLQSGNNLM